MPRLPGLHKCFTPHRDGRRPGVVLKAATVAAMTLLFAAAHTPGDARSTPVEGSAQELVPQTSITCEMAGGQTRSFEIALRRGQRLRVELTKGDMRVAVAAFGPGGRPGGEFASLSYAPLVVSLIAQADGAHRLEVRSLESAAEPRSVSLGVRGLKVADASDRADDEALGLFSEAERLRETWVAGDLRRAVEMYTAAWSVWRRVGYRREAARALEAAGECHFNMGAYPQAVAFFDRARAESRAARDRRGEITALNNAGRVFGYTGDKQKVLAYAERVLSRLGERAAPPGAEDRRAEAQALCNMGEAYYSLGRLSDALKMFDRAHAIWAEVGDRAGQALARLAKGYAHADAGELQEAAESYGQSLALWRAAGDRRGEALTMTATGGVHSFLDDKRLALNLHRRAKEIFDLLGDRQGAAAALNGIARAYEGLNEPQAALEHYLRALEIYREIRSRDAESVSLLYIGRLHRSTGRTAEALDYCNRSRELSRRLRKSRMEAYALIELAAIHHAQGRARQALGMYGRQLNLYTRIGDRRGQAKALNQIGDAHHTAGQAARALDFYKRALSFSQAAKDRAEEIATRYNIARAARDCGRLQEALGNIESAVGLSESARTRIAGYGLRASYFTAARKHYELYIDLLMEADKERPGEGFAARALRVSEGARSRSLLDLLTEASVNVRQGVDLALLASERSLEQSLSSKAQYLTRLLSSESASEPPEEVEAGLRRLTREYEEVQARIRDQSPLYATLTQPRLLSLEDVQKELRDDTILLEYALGPEKSYLWAITASDFTAYELPARNDIERAAREVYTLLAAGQSDDGPPEERQSRPSESDQEYARKATALSAMLLGQVASRLGDKRLLIVPDGSLQYIPFEALPLPPHGATEQGAGDKQEGSALEHLVPLVVRHEVISLPSASLLAVIRQGAARRRRAEKTVIVLADPVFESDDPRVRRAAAACTHGGATDVKAALRSTFRGGAGSVEANRIPRLLSTRDEAEGIMSLTPEGQGALATDFAASRSAALGEHAGQFQIVHFATHGVVNHEHPELSGIILSMVNEQGGSENGVLQLHDIYNLNLAAELVVLSACDTGLGKDVRGEGLVGLTRGFLYAGARSVVASLWKVEDRATAELMGHFYREMLVEGASPPAALRAAKVAMWRQRRWSAPRYWAAFVLQGDPEAAVVVGDTGRGVGPATLAFLLLAGLAAGLYVLRRGRRSSADVGT